MPKGSGCGPAGGLLLQVGGPVVKIACGLQVQGVAVYAHQAGEVAVV